MKLFLVFVLVAVAIVSACNNRPRDCQDLWDQGFTTSTIYTIFPEYQSRGVRVRCDMAADDPGWTYIQFRNTSTSFDQLWRDYQNGFGDPATDHWLGNRYISKITAQDGYQLRIDMTLGDVDKYALYNHFQVFDASTKYQLLVSGYDSTSTAVDELWYHDGMPFTTSDVQNDNHSGENCATLFSGGWWHNACLRANLNGKWGSTVSGEGLNWYGFTGYSESLTRTEMKIRRFKP